MKLARSWVVARKDLEEALASRFLMSTVILLPFLFAVVAPVSTLVPLSTLPSRTTPLVVELGRNGTIDNATISDRLLVNVTLDHCVLSNDSLVHDFLGNSTLNFSYVAASVLWNVSLHDSVVKGSNLFAGHVDAASTLVGSVEVGQPSTLEVTADSILSLYLVFFILIPVIIPAVMASNSIVGEKTNRSLEPLLASPLSASELLAGKTMAILLPTVLTTWGAFAAFSVIVSASLDRLIGSSPVPNATWYLTILVVAPLVALLSIALNVIVSSRVSDVRVSQQLGTLVIFPILFFFLGGLVGAYALGPTSILALGAVVAIADVVTFVLAIRLFDRETVLLRWK